MALLYPFRGYRYSRDVVGDLELVVTQPYNRISPALQKEYCRRSPYSVVRVTRSLEKLDNPETNYSEAARALQSWIDRGALLQDRQPGMYAYYQQFNFQGENFLRKGFIALLDLPHSAACVMPHERILAESKMDRLSLLRSVECNEDALFMIYTEDRLKVNRILDETASARPPELEFTNSGPSRTRKPSAGSRMAWFRRNSSSPMACIASTPLSTTGGNVPPMVGSPRPQNPSTPAWCRVSTAQKDPSRFCRPTG
jgi:uncharacterized protein (DUF1015 family)